MKILAIDTVTERCSAALWLDGALFERDAIDPTGHSHRILDMVDAVLGESALRLDDLDAVAVDVGPGSFTGVRIGLGVAQGLAYGAGLPVIGVSSLAALARQMAPGKRVLAAIDARMNEVYWAAFHREDEGVQPLGEMALSGPESVCLPAGSGAVSDWFGLGSGWDRYAETLTGQTGVSGWQPSCYPGAREIAALAVLQPPSTWQDAAQLQPQYLRNEVAKKSTRSPLAGG